MPFWYFQAMFKNVKMAKVDQKVKEFNLYFLVNFVHFDIFEHWLKIPKIVKSDTQNTFFEEQRSQEWLLGHFSGCLKMSKTVKIDQKGQQLYFLVDFGDFSTFLTLAKIPSYDLYKSQESPGSPKSPGSLDSPVRVQIICVNTGARTVSRQ